MDGGHTRTRAAGTGSIEMHAYHLLCSSRRSSEGGTTSPLRRLLSLAVLGRSASAYLGAVALMRAACASMTEASRDLVGLSGIGAR